MSLTKKQVKIQKRKKKLEKLAEHDLVYCEHHHFALSVKDIYYHKCYNGNHGTRYCQYVKFGQREENEA